jgi:prolyl oligopeptidase
METFMPIQYPATPKSGTVDDYHGTPVADPYRWLVEAQNQLTRDNLDQNPALGKIKARLTELWNFPKCETIKRSSGKYYFTKNNGLQNQAVLYVQDIPEAEPRVLLDPNSLSDDGTVALIEQFYSPAGSLLAYILAASGSDRQEIHLLDTASGKKHQDVLQWRKFTKIAWKPDQSGFFYNRLPEPGTVPNEELNQHVKVYFHTLGTPQSSDTLIFENPADKTLRFYPHVTDSGDYLYLFTMRGTDRRNGIYLRPMNSDGDFQHLVEDGEAKFMLIGNQGSIFYFHTNLDAPRGWV